MFEKPKLLDQKIIACMRDVYAVSAVDVVFLPLGADPNTAVYRLLTEDGTLYFLKLRQGIFDETVALLLKFLSDQGIAQVIAPIATITSQLWASLDDFTTILYPFVEGRNGFEVHLANHHWVEFGSILKRIHSVMLPLKLVDRIRQESFSPRWREMVKSFMEQVEADSFDDPVAVKLATFLQAKRAEVFALVQRAERFARTLQGQSLEFVLCHSDIHAGNVLIDTNGTLNIVDWDEPILAPKERDLMFVGGGVAGVWNQAQEEALFYQGYGETEINPAALVYYRYERIVQDIAVTCEQLLLTDEGGQNREQGFQFLEDQFLSNNVVEIAHRTEENLIT